MQTKEKIARFGADGKMGARLSKNLLVDFHPEVIH